MAKRKVRKGKPQFTPRQREVESEDMKSRPNRVRPDRRGTYDATTSMPNDWRWYAQNEQLVRDYASYPFGTPLGNPKQFGASGNYGLNYGSYPGVMAIDFYPAIGYADNENSPINVAMRRVYSYVRHANSGASNYDAPDLMLYLICVDSAIMFHSWIKRLYGVMQDYTPWNRYYPKYLVQMMGFDFDDIEANLNDLRGYINQYAVKLSQLWVPNSMSYMARHSWMCEGLYTDSTSPKAQTYFYNPAGFYKFTLDTDGVGSAAMTAKPANLTLSSLITFGNSLLNPMISNEDFGIMSGDILKAFGEGGIIRIEGITEGYQILPVYSQEVLSQIENSTQVDANYRSFNVTQTTSVGTGFLVSTPVSQKILYSGVGTAPAATDDGFIAAIEGPKLLNFHHQGITPEEVMVATRLSQILENVKYVSSGSAVSLTADVTTAGSEVIVRYRMGFLQYTDSGVILQSPDVDSFDTVRTSADWSSIQDSFTRLAMMENFDWHPWLSLAYVEVTSNSVIAHGPQIQMVDADFYTFLDRNNLKNMTMTALLSEFSIPQI